MEQKEKKKHPKGLIAASLANMGERYGFYTMMAILVLFLQAKFGLGEKATSLIYSIFYALIYLSALLGGAIADYSKNYKGTILKGLLVMALGYLILSVPTPTPVPNKALFLSLSLFALLIIAFGNGLFKGNLQALVGQMYDKLKKETGEDEGRDEGYRIFYMFINVGALVAPFTAVFIRNWWLGRHGYKYVAELPSLAYAYLEGKIQGDDLVKLQNLALDASNGTMVSLDKFIPEYLNVFTTGFHYAFSIAILAMLVSLAIYLANKNKFPEPLSKTKEESKADVTKEDVEEVKQRLKALFAVFGVVIFFWFSFHQNGLTLTYFARDYTNLSAIHFKILGIPIKGAELFQSINPFFIITLTLLILLVNRLFNLEKTAKMSTPKKIALGMFIAASAYIFLTVVSWHLPPFKEIDPAQGGFPLDDAQKVSPMVLVVVYFLLTVAELYISPLGLSFVSKVAPAKYQGVMQGAWLGATALGNQLLFIAAFIYKTSYLWLTWVVLASVAIIAGIIMWSMVKWLERITEEKDKLPKEAETAEEAN